MADSTARVALSDLAMLTIVLPLASIFAMHLALISFTQLHQKQVLWPFLTASAESTDARVPIFTAVSFFIH
jgi:hypothetical protein